MTTTTNGKTFSYADHCHLAHLIYRRFGENSLAATEAWRRMMQNDCTVDEFCQMLDDYYE